MTYHIDRVDLRAVAGLGKGVEQRAREDVIGVCGSLTHTTRDANAVTYIDIQFVTPPAAGHPEGT
jgi:hypothetical protein